jgi:DEAD/DEAH box helicase domain-containing protein
MTIESRISLTSLAAKLSNRAARAAISELRLRNDSLRRYLESEFDRNPGTESSFLADPVIEAAFPYAEVPETMRDLAGGLVEPALVDALDAPPRELREHRFGADWHPYTHQVASWEAAQDTTVRAVIVSSGTGSGKTECFLIPILNELVRQAELRPLAGVQALFLYPLNALINSQRDRLRAWTKGFGGRIRYCLYNGDTPETVPAADQSVAKEEVLSRKLLRSDPPSLLVTNATMLEYMLVRRNDAPILSKSEGLLKWIVIDEAHSYIGSQAAEMSMLLRRVIDAFGTDRSQLKVIATSATLGGGPDATNQMASFVADLAGVKKSAVRVIHGARRLPELPASLVGRSDSLPRLKDLAALEAAERYQALAASPAFRGLREAVARTPHLATQIAQRLASARAERWDTRTVLHFLDLAANAAANDDPLLPIRAHFFHRTLVGVWACLRKDCPEKPLGLEPGDWPFGTVYFRRRESCTSRCGGIVYEVMRCVACGEPYLAGEEVSDAAGDTLRPTRPTDENEDDDFQLLANEDDAHEDEEAGEPESVGAEDRARRYLTFRRAADSTNQIQVDPTTGAIVQIAQPVSVLVSADDGTLHCVSCGASSTAARRRLSSLRVGAPFLLNVAIPTLLEATAGPKPKKPFGGRRLITFSDSRQGTAKFAVRLQADTDRNRVRSAIYHQLHADKGGLSQAEVDEIRRTIEELTRLPPTPGLARLIEQEERRLKDVRDSISWSAMADSLERDNAIRDWMASDLNEVSFGELSRSGFGHFCLLRELIRRPRVQNSLETMGLAAVRYPSIDALSEARLPNAFRHRGLGIQDWRDFLYLILDHYVRANTAVEVPRSFFGWMGTPMRTSYVVAPEAERTQENQVLWPSSRRPSKVATLARLGLGLDQSNPDDQRELEQVLTDAWEPIRLLMKSFADGYLLDLKEWGAVGRVSSAAVCPITRRFLWRPFATLTPNVERGATSAPRCESASLPAIAAAWWRDPSGRQWSEAEVEQWISSDETITELRSRGLWGYPQDRVVSEAPYFRTAEHSAQQRASDLRRFEADFKEGDINVLSCSTTMEMGVDIGGMSAIAMNNAPPNPSNFLQRAGRAGRRGEPVTASLTLCKADPHGEAVFANPLWPFVTPIFIPRVSLDSARIIRRHVSAFLLSSFLKSGEHDPPKLTTGWFFGGGSERSPAATFRAFLERIAHIDGMVERLASLTLGSALAIEEVEALIGQTVTHLEGIEQRWTSELKALDASIEELTKSGASPQSAGVIAATRQRERLVDEYLLRDLTARGFLPGHGFPSDVVPFVNTTIRQLRHERQPGFGREDSYLRRQGYPSRELALAIRDYAPGNEVVLNGRVFESEGVTLNWHIPPGDSEVRETQEFEWAWRCPACAGTGSLRTRPTKCPACDRVVPGFDCHEYLQPAGFAVGVTYRPHNRVSSGLYVRVEDPWITAGSAEWQPLTGSIPGRYRASSEGHVFHHSKGLARHGFAICLRCGRAASDHGIEDPRQPTSLRNHTRLRGGKEDDGNSLCSGNGEQWAVKRRTWLGVAHRTDVFEVQLTPHSSSMDETAAFSISIALRRALAERLGVDEREIGASAQQQRLYDQSAGWSAVLFDRATSGAGYSILAVENPQQLLVRARNFLHCDCDRACHKCLITFETQHRADKLDRVAGLGILNST